MFRPEYTLDDLCYDGSACNMHVLRRIATQLGINPLPRTKVEVCQAIARSIGIELDSNRVAIDFPPIFRSLASYEPIAHAIMGTDGQLHEEEDYNRYDPRVSPYNRVPLGDGIYSAPLSTYIREYEDQIGMVPRPLAPRVVPPRPLAPRVMPPRPLAPRDVVPRPPAPMFDLFANPYMFAGAQGGAQGDEDPEEPEAPEAPRNRSRRR